MIQRLNPDAAGTILVGVLVEDNADGCARRAQGETGEAAGARIQCRVSGGGVPINLRIVSGGIRSLPAISSAVGSRPIACRMFRQVRSILFKASMVATDKWTCITIPRSLPHGLTAPKPSLEGSPCGAPPAGLRRYWLACGSRGPKHQRDVPPIGLLGRLESSSHKRKLAGPFPDS
jgi:hypothetical protein